MDWSGVALIRRPAPTRGTTDFHNKADWSLLVND